MWRQQGDSYDSGNPNDRQHPQDYAHTPRFRNRERRRMPPADVNNQNQDGYVYDYNNYHPKAYQTSGTNTFPNSNRSRSRSTRRRPTTRPTLGHHEVVPAYRHSFDPRNNNQYDEVAPNYTPPPHYDEYYENDYQGYDGVTNDSTEYDGVTNDSTEYDPRRRSHLKRHYEESGEYNTYNKRRFQSNETHVSHSNRYNSQYTNGHYENTFNNDNDYEDSAPPQSSDEVESEQDFNSTHSYDEHDSEVQHGQSDDSSDSSADEQDQPDVFNQPDVFDQVGNNYEQRSLGERIGKPPTSSSFNQTIPLMPKKAPISFKNFKSPTREERNDDQMKIQDDIVMLGKLIAMNNQNNETLQQLEKEDSEKQPSPGTTNDSSPIKPIISFKNHTMNKGSSASPSPILAQLPRRPFLETNSVYKEPHSSRSQSNSVKDNRTETAGISRANIKADKDTQTSRDKVSSSTPSNVSMEPRNLAMPKSIAKSHTTNDTLKVSDTKISETKPEITHTTTQKLDELRQLDKLHGTVKQNSVNPLKSVSLSVSDQIEGNNSPLNKQDEGTPDSKNSAKEKILSTVVTNTPAGSIKTEEVEPQKDLVVNGIGENHPRSTEKTGIVDASSDNGTGASNKSLFNGELTLNTTLEPSEVNSDKRIDDEEQKPDKLPSSILKSNLKPTVSATVSDYAETTKSTKKVKFSDSVAFKPKTTSETLEIQRTITPNENNHADNMPLSETLSIVAPTSTAYSMAKTSNATTKNQKINATILEEQHDDKIVKSEEEKDLIKREEHYSSRKENTIKEDNDHQITTPEAPNQLVIAHQESQISLPDCFTETLYGQNAEYDPFAQENLDDEAALPPNFVGKFFPEDFIPTPSTSKISVTEEYAFYKPPTRAKSFRSLNIFRFDHTMISTLLPNRELYTPSTYNDLISSEDREFNWYTQVLPEYERHFQTGNLFEVSQDENIDLSPLSGSSTHSLHYLWSELLLKIVKDKTLIPNNTNVLIVDRILGNPQGLKDDLRILSFNGIRFHFVLMAPKYSRNNLYYNLFEEIFHSKYSWCQRVQRVEVYDWEKNTMRLNLKRNGWRGSNLSIQVYQTPKYTRYGRNRKGEIGKVVSAFMAGNFYPLKLSESITATCFQLTVESVEKVHNFLLEKQCLPHADQARRFQYDWIDLIITRSRMSNQEMMELQDWKPFTGSLLSYGKIDNMLYAVELLVNTENKRWLYGRPIMIIAVDKTLMRNSIRALLDTIEWHTADLIGDLHMNLNIKSACKIE